jgi:hypothetical protein
VKPGHTSEIAKLIKLITSDARRIARCVMTRVSDPLGFSSLPRQLRRRIERQLRKLARPGVCLRAALCLSTDLLPLPDEEAVACALLEVAAQRETMLRDPQAFHALIEKYTIPQESSQ